MSISQQLITAPFAVIGEVEAELLSRLVHTHPAIVAERLEEDARVHDRADNVIKAGVIRSLIEEIAR
jgi:hypothetical protein